MAENLVFLKLRERMLKEPLMDIYYWKQKHEVDFIVKRGKNFEEIIQAGISKRFFGIKRCTVMTGEYEDEEMVDGVRVLN